MSLLIIAVGVFLLFSLFARAFPLTALAFVLVIVAVAHAGGDMSDATAHSWGAVIVIAFVGDILAAVFKPRCH